MSWLHAGAVVVLLASGVTSPALATCVSKKCSDAALVGRARVSTQQTCGCMKAGQSHRAYVTCVRKALKVAEPPGLTLQRPCRNLVTRCESKSICGDAAAVVCCKTKKSGNVVASIRKSAAQCRNGIACGASLGLYSTFDACGAAGACAAQETTTTTTTTTTTPPLGCGAERAAFEAGLPVPTPATRHRLQQATSSWDALRTDRLHDSDDENVDGGSSGEAVLTEREIEGALEAGGEERDEKRDRNRRHERRHQTHPATEPRVPISCHEHRPEPSSRQGERDEVVLPE